MDKQILRLSLIHVGYKTRLQLNKPSVNTEQLKVRKRDIVFPINTSIEHCLQNKHVNI